MNGFLCIICLLQHARMSMLKMDNADNLADQINLLNWAKKIQVNDEILCVRV